MEETFENENLSLKDSLVKKTNNTIKSNKCNQCGYASSEAGNLRRHLKAHSGEQLNKCNQCNYASPHAFDLRRHLKTHSGEKPNKCNHCNYASSRADVLRIHLKKHDRESFNKVSTNTLESKMHIVAHHSCKSFCLS